MASKTASDALVETLLDVPPALKSARDARAPDAANFVGFVCLVFSHEAHKGHEANPAGMKIARSIPPVIPAKAGDPSLSSYGCFLHDPSRRGVGPGLRRDHGC